MGVSNGAALAHQLMAESQLPELRHFITSVCQLNVHQHDGKNFKAKGDDNSYAAIVSPMRGRRLLNIAGTEDEVIPYDGSPSPTVAGKDGGLAFLHAERSTFVWAQAMGYDGEQLEKPTRRRGAFHIYSYLDGDVVHYKVNGRGHDATNAVDERTLLDFIQR